MTKYWPIWRGSFHLVLVGIALTSPVTSRPTQFTMPSPPKFSAVQGRTEQAATRLMPQRRRSPQMSRVRCLRGGSVQHSDDTGVACEAEGESEGGECLWLLQQLSLRQQRLALLSGALEEAGCEPLPTLKKRGPVMKVAKPWECTLAPSDDDDEEDEEEIPQEEEVVLPCLIMGEVLPGYKAVSPQGTGKWVTLWELNKMRRSEPEKVSGLWYDQFSMDCGFFSAQAGPPGEVLAYLLDRPWALRSSVLLGAGVVAGVFHKPLAVVIVKVLSSGLLWRSFDTWSRFLYAPLPAKIYFAQMIWSMLLAKQLQALETLVREVLIEKECELIEFSMPVTATTTTTTAAKGAVA